MKKIFFSLAVFYAVGANAQNYLITFAGTGASTNVGFVKVENLTSGSSLSISGTDILHLTDIVTESYSTIDKQSTEIMIYPNPVTRNTLIQFYPPEAGRAVVSVTDINGKVLVQTESFLNIGLHEFKLSGLKSGFFLISITGNGFHYSGKLLSNNDSNGTITLEEISRSQATENKPAKKADFKGIQANIDMYYTNGDRIKFTGISGDYSTVITDIPSVDKTITFDFIACKDGDNINYPVVKIGEQVWMAENLKTTKYRNSDLIGTTSPATLDITGESEPKYQWAYNGNESLVNIYGRLYTWYAITDSRNVCPEGWHLPTNDEWTTLTDFLTNNGYGYEGSGSDIAKSMAATSGWTTSSNAGGAGNDQLSNNSSGYTALPGGDYAPYGLFNGLGWESRWWTDSDWIRYLYSTDSNLPSVTVVLNSGASVRCVKD